LVPSNAVPCTLFPRQSWQDFPDELHTEAFEHCRPADMVLDHITSTITRLANYFLEAADASAVAGKDLSIQEQLQVNFHGHQLRSGNATDHVFAEPTLQVKHGRILNLNVERDLVTLNFQLIPGRAITFRASTALRARGLLSPRFHPFIEPLDPFSQSGMNSACLREYSHFNRNELRLMTFNNLNNEPVYAAHFSAVSILYLFVETIPDELHA
jgi:hypothetical protein